MLSTWRTLLLGLWLTRSAFAAGLIEPERLTAGAHDQYLGVATPDGAGLYYIDNQHATSELYARVGQGAGARLFDEAADVSWPRVSPDAKHLLYISHRDDAFGDACVRKLDGSDRRCLSDPKTAAVQALWLSDSEIGVVTRASLHGAAELRRWKLSSLSGQGERVLERSLSSPAISPNGRWLIYLPLDRAQADIGVHFAVRPARHFELVDLADRNAKPRLVEFRLPGVSGFPAFSVDGAALLFSQYLNDTNLDGRIDANDHSVLFRVAFTQDGAKAPIAPADFAAPEQLTSAAWNCQYPAPAKDRLITTCSIAGSLDVYRLPLAGSIAPNLSRARLDDERDAARGPWDRLLWVSRTLRVEKSVAGRVALYAEMIRLHLALEEFESAAYYAGRLGEEAGATGYWASVAKVLEELIAHRRSERSLERGLLSDTFVATERARLERLDRAAPNEPTGLRAWRALAAAEVFEVIGDKEAALARLHAIDLDAIDANTNDPLLLHLIAQVADDLYAQFDDRAALVEMKRRLAMHQGLSERERVMYASAFVRELSRGRSLAEQKSALKSAAAGLAPDGELAMMVALEAELAQVTRERVDSTREAIFQLYRRNRGPVRRRAIVELTLARAAERDNEFLLYEFANTWASGLDRAGAERAYGEVLYRDVVLERAYGAWRKGATADARGYFFGVTLQTDSLEAYLGFIDARRQEGKDPFAELKPRLAAPKDAVLRDFLDAYAKLLAPRANGNANATDLRRVALLEARTLLERCAAGLGTRIELHHLLGALAHELYRLFKDPIEAETANTHYTLALDAARKHPRYRARLQEALGALHVEVGNFRIAIQHLAARMRLPFPEPRAELATRLYLARARFHAEEDAVATQEIHRALAISDGNVALRKYRALALDRAGLYELSSGDAKKARQTEAVLLPLSVADAENRPRQALVDAAAAIELGEFHAAEESLARARDSNEELIVLGLSAEAARGKGNYAEAERASAKRRERLLALDRKAPVDERQLELAEEAMRSAELAYRRGDKEGAKGHILTGLDHANQFSKATGTKVHAQLLGLILQAAELTLVGAVPVEGWGFDLAARVTELYTHIARARDVRWEPARERLGVYSAWFGLQK